MARFNWKKPIAPQKKENVKTDLNKPYKQAPKAPPMTAQGTPDIKEMRAQVKDWMIKYRVGKWK